MSRAFQIFCGAHGTVLNHNTDGGEAAIQRFDGQEPESMESWSKLHEAVEGLPENERPSTCLGTKGFLNKTPHHYFRSRRRHPLSSRR